MMIIWIAVVFVLTLFYGMMMMLYLYGWLMTKEFRRDNAIHDEIFFSVIIPMRNEEKNLPNLLNDFSQLNYPSENWEVIFIDDYSEDNSINVVKKFSGKNISVFSMKEISGAEKNMRFKKQAIEYGIAKAKGNWIITTDADCRVQPEWLKTINSFIQRQPLKMVAAPVLFANEKSVFEKMQSLDFCGLMGITAATLQIHFPTMCNGANLAFEKKVFYDVNGYTGNDKLASGDDLFLMHKVFSQFPEQVKFLKSNEASVYTAATSSFKEFFWQRVRWTSKSAHYTDKKITVVLAMSYLFNVSMLLNAFLIPVNKLFLLLLLFQMAIKMITEFSLLIQVCDFFRKKNLMFWFLPAQIFHVLYVAVIGLAGITLNYKWKERSLK